MNTDEAGLILAESIVELAREKGYRGRLDLALKDGFKHDRDCFIPEEIEIIEEIVERATFYLGAAEKRSRS